MKLPKELIKEYVKSEKFTSTTDIMDSIRSMFADVLNEVLQCELDEQLGEVEISVPRDRNGEYEPKIISKYQRNADGLEDKILSLYTHGMSIRDSISFPRREAVSLIPIVFPTIQQARN